MLISRTRHAEIIPIYHGLTISGRPSLSGGVLSILWECCAPRLFFLPLVFPQTSWHFVLSIFFGLCFHAFVFSSSSSCVRCFYVPVPFASPASCVYFVCPLLSLVWLIESFFLLCELRFLFFLAGAGGGAAKRGTACWRWPVGSSSSSAGKVSKNMF